MKVAVVTDSSNFAKRALFVARHYTALRHETYLILSDFDHAAKEKIDTGRVLADRKAQDPAFVFIDTVPYRKNISPKRLFYHHDFAKKAGEKLLELSPDLLYVLLPANSLAPIACEIKEKCGARLVFDIIDLWPESLPTGLFRGTFPYRYWQNLRDISLGEADLLMAECGFYIEKLALPEEKSLVMYFVGSETPFEKETEPKTAGDTETAAERGEGALGIAYLGAVNNIIDIERISALLSELAGRTPIHLHIIGGGERKEAFLAALSGIGIEHTYYGKVYDETEKNSILSKASWGLNIMKPEVQTGLTMKSIDYMKVGLRLINSIGGDTRELVDRYALGVNIGEDISETADRILSFEGASKEEIQKVSGEYFSAEAAEKALCEADRLLGTENIS